MSWNQVWATQQAESIFVAFMWKSKRTLSTRSFFKSMTLSTCLKAEMIVFYMAGKAMLIQSFAALYNYAIKGEFSTEPWYALVKIDPSVYESVQVY